MAMPSHYSSQDSQRQLTAKGRDDVTQMALWLSRTLPRLLIECFAALTCALAKPLI